MSFFFQRRGVPVGTWLNGHPPLARPPVYEQESRSTLGAHLLIVKVELADGREIARMHIENDGTCDVGSRNVYGQAVRGSYDIAIFDAHAPRSPVRRARVVNFPRLALSAWELIRRALEKLNPITLTAPEDGLPEEDLQNAGTDENQPDKTQTDPYRGLGGRGRKDG